MGAYGSIAVGYDPGYLLRESSKGAEGYYLSAVAEIGEPPGVWTGRAGPGLGLPAGAEVDPAAMTALYGELVDPRDPAFTDPDVPAEDKDRLGSAPRQYKTAEQILDGLLAAEPDATPERAEQLQIQARKQARAAVMFFDFTFSADKSISVLHASLQAAAMRAGQDGRPEEAAHYAALADIVEKAVRAGAAAAVEYLQDEAGYSRAGYHGAVPRDEHGRPLAEHATGRYVDAHDWVVASFLQHTSRDGDPQLHVHNAILNRAECADGTWRTIDSRGLHKARAAASAVGGRVMDERIAGVLGAAFAQRPDLHGRELTGVPQRVKDMFSSRRTAIQAGVAELARQYADRHGRQPSARALFSMGQYVTLDSRRAKPRHEHAVPRAVTLAGWEAEMRAAELGALADIPARVIASLDPGIAPGIDAVGQAQLHRVLAAAVAEVQAARAVWGRSQLLAAIDAQLPGWLGGLDSGQVRSLLDQLTDQALAGGHGVVSLEAPELAETPQALRRADGRSIYSPHDRALYTTRPQLDAEEQVLAAAGQDGGPAADPDAAAAALGGTRAELSGLPGRSRPGAAPVPAFGARPAGRSWADGLRDDQAAAVYGILTSGRPADVLVGPAGTGKSRTMGTLSHLWHQLTGANVIGVATAENAAQVLAAEGLDTAWNIAMFLTLSGSGRRLLHAGDLLIVDEASMVSTAQLTALHQITTAAGAKMLLTGDPAQLPAIGAGGALAMIARQHGCYQLTVVQRMNQPWERSASLRLRDGDTGVLADYDRHGRLLDGTAEEMETAAYRNWLADYLNGKDTLLIARTKEQAADLSRRAQADLAAVGLVKGDGIPLEDGNTAGVGDLVQARHNDRTIRDTGGRWAANRDVWRIQGVSRSHLSGETILTVQRDQGLDSATGIRAWSPAFPVPSQYLEDHAVLAYATTVHAAEGRTVDTCHALAGEGLSRALLYVAMTRGRESNRTYVTTEPSTADLRPGTAPASQLAVTTRPAPSGQNEAGQKADQIPAAQPGSARQKQRETWAPPLDRFSVLAATLERSETDLPALEVLAAELARSGHLAHLGAIWTDLVEQESAARYDAIVRRSLTEQEYDRYSTADARTTLHRQVRVAELAGLDPAVLLPQAVQLRPLGDAPGRGPAEDVAKVLHSRVREIAGHVAPRAASYTQRTPRAADPEIGRFLDGLAGLMDQRIAELGDRAVQDPPPWALDHLGPLPDGVLERQAWAARAGTAATYRERYAHIDAHDAIGREPAAPEARADWHAARAALGIPEDEAGVATASTAGLWARRARYERELAWAPPHVGADLRATGLARREHATEATLARARARTAGPAARAGLLARAEAHRQLAGSLELRETVLADVDAQRARWHDATAQTRSEAQDATAELRRRLPGTEISRLHTPPGERSRSAETPSAAPHPATSTAQPELGSAELRRASGLADLARRTLDERHAQAQRDADREQQRQADEPSPARWPHRNPGYRIDALHRRQAETIAAQFAAQDFPHPPDLADPAAGRSGHEPPSPRPHHAERNEPEMTL
jgi:hypothetical protein